MQEIHSYRLPDRDPLNLFKTCSKWESIIFQGNLFQCQTPFTVWTSFSIQISCNGKIKDKKKKSNIKTISTACLHSSKVYGKIVLVTDMQTTLLIFIYLFIRKGASMHKHLIWATEGFHNDIIARTSQQTFSACGQDRAGSRSFLSQMQTNICLACRLCFFTRLTNIGM